MQEDKSQLMHYAMLYGLYLGVYWIVKYLFLIGASHFPAAAYIEVILRIGTPILLSYFLIKYRISVAGGQLNYWHGIQFGIMLFFSAAILEAVVIFVHTTWIDPQYISGIYDNMITLAKGIGMNGDVLKSIENQPIPTPISYVFSTMMSDVFLGLLLSLFIVPFANRFNPG